jgi:hypothetical protein
MRKIFAVLLLLICTASVIHAQKARYGQAPPKALGPAVKVHISASHIRESCTGNSGNIWCSPELFADAIVDGKKLELSGASEIEKHEFVVLSPGDYAAEPTKDVHNSDETVINREYNVLLPDGAVWHCIVTGISE